MDCPDCSGEGSVHDEDGDTVQCDYCGGSGYVVPDSAFLRSFTLDGTKGREAEAFLVCQLAPDDLNVFVFDTEDEVIRHLEAEEYKAYVVRLYNKRGCTHVDIENHT